LEHFREEVHIWHQYSATLLRTIFDNDQFYEEFSHYAGAISFGLPPIHEQWNEEKSELRSYVKRLRSIESRLPLIEEPTVSGPQKQHFSTEIAPNNDVFVVHGHSEEVKQSVARLLEKLQLRPIILHEQTNQNRTIIEKFEHYSNVRFAIILLTPDDVGSSKSNGAGMNARARQNVILEMEYFLGKLGRKNVAMLYVPGVELPSDLQGLLYIEYSNSDAWKFQLAKEMNAVGIRIDLNMIL
jgi:predicted nucleotide-binding protein